MTIHERYDLSLSPVGHNSRARSCVCRGAAGKDGWSSVATTTMTAWWWHKNESRKFRLNEYTDARQYNIACAGSVVTDSARRRRTGRGVGFDGGVTVCAHTYYI